MTVRLLLLLLVLLAACSHAEVYDLDRLVVDEDVDVDDGAAQLE